MNREEKTIKEFLEAFEEGGSKSHSPIFSEKESMDARELLEIMHLFDTAKRELKPSEASLVQALGLTRSPYMTPLEAWKQTTKKLHALGNGFFAIPLGAAVILVLGFLMMSNSDRNIPGQEIIIPATGNVEDATMAFAAFASQENDLYGNFEEDALLLANDVDSVDTFDTTATAIY